ncbi:MFS transporter [Kribbella solani]|uniref:Na+/melibiose symporter-like transporter n=1 Tax=Kribbella solani TaxID=236067 RepID=A0A841DIS6_9ACTN|nr:MFS transporter [Kribbella solani]MBB5977791.1 Na+/melibiose symporter-like transporter [Kribbella solani]
MTEETDSSRGRLTRLLPSGGLPRRLYFQTLIFSLGAGLTAGGNVVFFVKYLRLTAEQIGVGLSVAMAVSAACTLPLGKLVDRWGPRRVWFGCAIAEVVLHLLYPFSQALWMFVAIQAILTVVTSTGNSARSVYSYAVISGPTRVKTLAHFRTGFNVGFTVGGLVAAGILLLPSDRLLVLVPLCAAALFVVNTVYIARLPKVANETRRTKPKSEAPGRAALRNGKFVLFCLLNGLIGTHQTVLMVILPLWILRGTSAPPWVVPGILIVNTALVITSQVWLSRLADTLRGAIRASALGSLAAGIACALLALTGHGDVAAVMLLLIVGVVGLTLCEMWQSAGEWGWFPHFAPAAQRGEYQAVLRLAAQIPMFLAPVAFTQVVIGGGRVGWIAVALLYGAVAVVVPMLGHRVRAWDDEASATVEEGSRT